MHVEAVDPATCAVIWQRRAGAPRPRRRAGRGRRGLHVAGTFPDVLYALRQTAVAWDLQLPASAGRGADRTTTTCGRAVVGACSSR